MDETRKAIPQLLKLPDDRLAVAGFAAGPNRAESRGKFDCFLAILMQQSFVGQKLDAQPPCEFIFCFSIGDGDNRSPRGKQRVGYYAAMTTESDDNHGKHAGFGHKRGFCRVGR